MQRAGHWARLILTSKTGQHQHQGANADGGNFRIKWRILKFYPRARSARIGENKWYSNYSVIGTGDWRWGRGFRIGNAVTIGPADPAPQGEAPFYGGAQIPY